ncbi:MAG: DUF1570 domain-containing protein, partial [Pirellulaceae bacterium]
QRGVPRVRTGCLAARNRWRSAGWAMGLIALVAGSPCWGQGAGAIVDPKQFGLDLPPGPLHVCQGECVSTVDDDGMLVVGRLHARVGDSAVVMLPDGQLVPRKRDEFTLTDRKFAPISRGALATRLDAEFKDFKVRHSKHYVYVCKSSDKFWIGTTSILETMLDGVMAQAKGFGIQVREPELPLVVVLFANKAEFQKYRKVPDDVTAYYHPLSNRVFLYEPVELGELSRELALSQAISTVAHEGAHQILHNIGVQQRLSAWPMWISEGLAEYYAPTTFGKNLAWKGPGRNDLRMFELQRYLKNREKVPADGGMIELTVTTPVLSSTGYASAWAITHFLIKTEKDQFRQYLQQVSRLGPLEGPVGGNGSPPVLENLELFQSHFGKDMPALETRLVAYLKRQPYKDPFADLPHFLVQIVVKIDRQLHYQAEIFYSSVLAKAWADKTIAALPPEQRAEASLHIAKHDSRAAADLIKKTWLKKGPPVPLNRN